MLRNTHEEHNPQMTQMDADVQKRDEQTYAVIGAQRIEHKRFVFNLRESASSADK